MPGMMVSPMTSSITPGRVLSIQLLGDFCVRVGSQPVAAVHWRRRSAATLIKLLALTPGHRLHREQLQDLLWPEFDRTQGASNLHRTLHHARRALESAGTENRASVQVRLDRDTVALTTAETPLVDVVAFESAAAAAQRSRDPADRERALLLYTGDLLPEDRYADWTEMRREALRALYRRLLSGLAALHEEHGAVAEAIASHQRALSVEPADETSHLALIRLYASSGQRSDALRQYERLCTALRRDLDAPPSAAAVTLYQRLLAGDPTLENANVAASSWLSPGPPSPSRPPTLARATSPPPGGSDGFEVPAPLRARLPRPTTRFVGRANELLQLRQALVDRRARLLTLTGTGGVGKTRLAIELATQVHGAFPDGIAFLSFASITDPRHGWSSAAQQLDIVATSSEPSLDRLVAAIGERRMLLLLDNFEHLLPLAPDVAALVASCPNVAVVVTSRAPLRLSEEQLFAVHPFPQPQVDPSSTADDYLTWEAIHLFTERARDAGVELTLTAQSAAVIAEICRHLDGLPLAIELAVPRLRLLTLDGLIARLPSGLDAGRGRLALLSGGPRDAPPRQQTLTGTIAWSYDLLSPGEQTLFRRLSVFQGSFTLDGAEALADSAGAPTVVLDQLAVLVDSALVSKSGQGMRNERIVQEAPRLAMLETIREFAHERLIACGERNHARERHAMYCLALAEQAERAMHGPRQIEWYDRLEREHGNLQTALRWALDGEEVELGVRLAYALRWYWEVRSHAAEARDWLKDLLAMPALAERPAFHARALLALAHMAHMQRLNGLAWSASDRSIALARAGGNHHILADALLFKGMALKASRRFAEARDTLLESLALWRDLAVPWGIAQALEYLGATTRDGGNPNRALPLYEEALVRRQVLQDWRGMAQTLQSLGNLALMQSDYETAQDRSEASLAIARLMGDRSRMAISLVALGEVARRQQDAARARARFEEILSALPAPEEVSGQARWARAHSSYHLAELARVQGDEARASALYLEGVQFWLSPDREGDHRIHGCAAAALAGLAVLAAQKGDLDRAARLLGAGDRAIHEAHGLEGSRMIQLYDRSAFDAVAAIVRAQLAGHPAASVWLDEGRRMSPLEVVAYATGLTP
jgi:predicted ATPase/DNA-binding SARP family transcriptional activator